MLSLLDQPGFFLGDELHIDANFIGEGYAVPTAESLDAMQLFAETEGILLDPVYTSKAAAGLVAYCREGRFKPSERALFWHTGGVLTLLYCGPLKAPNHSRWISHRNYLWLSVRGV